MNLSCSNNLTNFQKTDIKFVSRLKHHVANLNEMHNNFLDNGFETSELYKEIHPDGAHSEWYWNREFPDAYEWLYANDPINDKRSYHRGVDIRGNRVGD